MIGRHAIAGEAVGFGGAPPVGGQPPAPRLDRPGALRVAARAAAVRAEADARLRPLRAKNMEIGA